MNTFLWRFGAFFICAPAFALQPADVQITADPAVTVTVNPRKGNTAKTIGVTVNAQDSVSLNGTQVYPTNHHTGIPVTGAAAWPTPQPGISDVALAQTGVIPPLPDPTDWEHDGAFRLLCNWTRMAFDDPIVYPGKQGVAHHHTFFGNTAVDAFTTPANIRSKGNASCRGGTINLSGYWVPSMIDTTTGAPIAPKSLLVYYKTGFWQYMADGSVIQPLPQGLRMITGTAANTTADGASGKFSCMLPDGTSRPGMADLPSIPPCLPGDELWERVGFNQCWDGKNLDSADHKSHMSGPEGWASGVPNRIYRCPADHPVVLPLITFITIYSVPANTTAWRLASDAYTGPAGYSAHGDWMNGWDPAISDLWGVQCLRARRDCGAANLGDGRVTQEFQGN